MVLPVAEQYQLSDLTGIVLCGCWLDDIRSCQKEAVVSVLLGHVCVCADTYRAGWFLMCNCHHDHALAGSMICAWCGRTFAWKIVREVWL